LEASESTLEKYRGVVKQFKEHLGPRVKQDITNITAADIVSFRDGLAQRLAVGTVNLAVKILRIAFGQARRDGLVDINEASRVSILKRQHEEIERRPFTLPELRRILEVANDEWKGAILFGLYSGQRLGDVAGLTWNNIDLQRSELRLTTAKRGRRMILPLATPLARYIESLPSSDKPDAPLFPRLSTAGNPSNQFYDLLVSAGMMPARSHRANPTKSGRSVRRIPNALSFHCLRHTATSLLKNAGVSESVAMEFIGHDSKSISQNYTHISPETMKEAAAKMPDVTL
jgi:integrase